MNIRAIAARTLVPVLNQKSALDSAFEEKQSLIEEKDRGFYKELCYGVCRHLFSLNAVLDQLLSKPLKSKDSDLKALLLVGLYQLWYMRVPDHAAINETVNAVKPLRKIWAKKLVNGLLRNFIRNQSTLIEKIGDSRYEHPPWLLNRVRQSWPECYGDILNNNNIQAPFTLRINCQKVERAAYSKTLTEKNIAHTLCTYSDSGITLESPIDVTLLPGFETGSCSVQDEAAQLAATLLDLQSQHRVLDACCAPGGKTCHIAELQNDLLSLVALDVDEKRMQRVEENLTRLQLKAQLKTADAAELDKWWDGVPFDRILLDAPCSATGVIRRHPDIKLLRRETDIASLSKLQIKILQNLWSALTPGGILVYATCSVLPEENENLVRNFVEQQDDAIHLAIEAEWGELRAYGRQLFPRQNGHDGFYYARIKKAQ